MGSAHILGGRARSGPGAPALEPFGAFRNVRKVFGEGQPNELVAIEDISFLLMPGQLVTLLGPSGCGKTTLLKIVAGLNQATSGCVEIEGTPVTRPRADFAFVFQQANLLPWRTVLKNILFPIEIRGESGPESLGRARELLDLVGLEGFEDRYPAELSGGMQQRVALCRALVHEAKLLLMDEPFGALDELTRMEMQDLLLDIRARTDAAVLFVTHSISESIYLSDEVIVFSKRPAVLADHIEVNLSYPRTAEHRYSSEFTALEHRAGRALGIVR